MAQFDELDGDTGKTYGIAAAVIVLLLLALGAWLWVGDGDVTDTSVDTSPEDMTLQPDDLPDDYDDYRIEDESSLSWEEVEDIGLEEDEYIEGYRAVYTDDDGSLIQKDLHRVEPGAQMDVQYMSEQLPSDHLKQVDLEDAGITGIENVEVWEFMMWRVDTETEEPAYVAEFTKHNVYVKIFSPDPGFEETDLISMIEQTADRIG